MALPSPCQLRSFAALVALVLVAGACSGPPGTSPSATTAAASPLVATSTTGTIRMTLTLEGPPRNDAASWASVRIENIGDRGIRWAGGGCGDPGGIFIDLHEVFPAGRMDWPGRLGVFKRRAVGPDPASSMLTLGYTAETRWGTAAACPASLQIETLPPRQSLFLRAGWDGTYEGLPVPTGPTKVEAVLAVIGVEGEVDPMDIETHAVSVSARTTIVGGDGGALLAPALAIDAALGDPQFAAWVQAADPAMWINPDVARIEGRWWIGLFRNGQDQATLLGEVQVDDDSRIVARRFDR